MRFSEMASNAQERAKQEELKGLRSQLASNTLSPVERNKTIRKIVDLEQYLADREIAQAAASVSDEMNLDFTKPGAIPSIPGIEVSEVEMAPGDFSQQGDKLEDIKERLLKMRALLEKANPITKPIIEERVKVLEATHAKLTEGEKSTPFLDTSDPNAFDNDPVIRTMDRQEKRSAALRQSLGIE